MVLTAIASPCAADDAEASDWRITTGAIFIGVGAASIVAGATVGTVAAAKYGDLDCPDDRCPPALVDEADDYNALREPSGLTIALGGVLSAIGGAFWYAAFTDPGDDPAVDLSLEAGPTYLGMRGRF